MRDQSDLCSLLIAETTLFEAVSGLSFIIIGESGTVLIYDIESSELISKNESRDEMNGAVWDVALSFDDRVLCIVRENASPELHNFRMLTCNSLNINYFSIKLT